MTYTPIPAAGGSLIQVLEVTSDTITVQSPINGLIKTIPRPSWYRPDGPAVFERSKAGPRTRLEESERRYNRPSRIVCHYPDRPEVLVGNEVYVYGATYFVVEVTAMAVELLCFDQWYGPRERAHPDFIKRHRSTERR
ncbi:MAG: hypothetical protein ABI895_29185 [Deltaproteobacteria bacterium]